MTVYAVLKYWNFPPKEFFIIAFPDQETMEKAIEEWHEARTNEVKNANLDRIEDSYKSSFAPCTGTPPLYARPPIGQKRRLKHKDEHLVS